MAEEEETEENGELGLHSAGDKLRLAREQKNLSIEEVAKMTRVPQRHLSSVETGDFGALPGRTYAIGFAKSYARAVGLSEATIGSQIRDEMEEQGHGAYKPETSGYAPANPTNIPPKYLAWTAGGIAAVLLVGFLIWRTLILEPSELADGSDGIEQVEAETVDQNSQAISSPQAGSPPAADGTVVLTANETVWLKIYDAEGERLFEDQMDEGERYTVPADANSPQILTGRPNALTVTIDGKVVQALGTAERTIKDVEISAAALLARNEAGPGDDGDQNN